MKAAGRLPQLSLASALGFFLSAALGAQAPTATQGPAREAVGPLKRSVPSPCDQGSTFEGLPPNFSETFVGTDWVQPVGLLFDPTGRLYVWEKSGVVWIVEDGVRLPEPLVDLSEEVGDWESHGLAGFALDPNFYTNGYIYLLYVVDKHHLLYYGTPRYDPGANLYWENTIGRLTRYTALAATEFTAVDPSSRTVLIGDTIDSGFPICGIHGVGSLVFFHDGTLAVSCGDGNEDGMSGTSCLADGIIELKEEVNSSRSQLLDTISGKILRIDPLTGAGLPDNPWFDAGDPMSARSRVWALGVRNPHRVTIRAEHPADRSQGPGTLLFGDVGASSWEELNVCHGGENFGWPIYQGMELMTTLAPYQNLDAPNPLYQQTIPGVGLCTEPYFYFQDLLVEDSLNPYAWPNPCDPSQAVPASIPHYSHTRPAMTWKHFTGPAIVPTFDASGGADSEVVGAPGSPVAGQPFQGNCSIGGAWYDGTSFPPEYHDTYFHADYGARWVRNFVFDAADKLVEVRNFAPTVGSVVTLAVDSVLGDLYYIDLDAADQKCVRKISYSAKDHPPLASFTATPAYGPGPLSVQLDASASVDPEGGSLTYVWDFGDGSPPKTGVSVEHTFPTFDKTLEGTIITKLDELIPPMPMGFGSLDADVIRDNVYPLLQSTYPLVQFDTLHYDQITLLPDKGLVDWIGYTFPTPREFRGLFFQEGIRWPGFVGGWFLLPTVKVRDATTGVWSDVTGLVSTPHYPLPTEPGGTTSFQTFEFDFDPVVGDGIRIEGLPGGSLKFVSVAELRVLSTGTTTAPKNYTVRLIVTDDTGKTDCTTREISVNNTPPTVGITSPANGAGLDVSQPVTLPFTATFFDAEQTGGTCKWQLTLVHDNHDHPEPPADACATSGTFAAHGMDPGDVLYWRVEMTRTDPLGLATTDTVYLYQANDCNFNGIDDAADILAGTSLDQNFDGKPDECDADCNGNGVHDLLDLANGTSEDLDGDKIPDECP